MLVIMWNVFEGGLKRLVVHYQCPIGAEDAGEAEWSWGPGDGAYLVPITETVATTMINKLGRVEMEVHSPSRVTADDQEDDNG